MQQQDLCYTNNNEYKTNGGNTLHSLLAVKGNTRDHIGYAISQFADSLSLRYRGVQMSDDIVQERTQTRRQFDNAER